MQERNISQKNPKNVCLFRKRYNNFIMENYFLKYRITEGSQVEQVAPDSWRLTIPAGTGKSYNWAQLDDYLDLPRSKFLWQKPIQMECQARVSNSALPGTWGFGFWNDPFNASLGIKGTAARLPVLPNAAWFFFASPENHLSLTTNSPAQGFLAAVFQSPLIPAGCCYPVILPFQFFLSGRLPDGCEKSLPGSSKIDRSL